MKSNVFISLLGNRDAHLSVNNNHAAEPKLLLFIIAYILFSNISYSLILRWIRKYFVQSLLFVPCSVQYSSFLFLDEQMEQTVLQEGGF